MKKPILFICSLLLIRSCLFAQKNETVVVKAGTSLMDYFPIADKANLLSVVVAKVTF